MSVRPLFVPLLALALVSLGSASVVSAGAIPVACGDTLAGRGILTGDLDCTTPVHQPITIAQGRLDLNGFTLLGAIVCHGSCKVSNGIVGGPITGQKSIGVKDAEVYGDINADGSVHVKNSVVSSGHRCISAYFGKIIVQDSTVTGCRAVGVDAEQNDVKITRSTVTGSRHVGVSGWRVRLNQATVTGSGFGVECGHSPLKFVCDGGADHGLECGPGVDCLGGTCRRGASCADVAAFKLPVLRASTCDTSRGAGGSPPNWGVCSLD